MPDPHSVSALINKQTSRLNSQQRQLEPSRNLFLENALRIILPARCLEPAHVRRPVAADRVLAWIRVVDVLELTQQSHALCNAIGVSEHLARRLRHQSVVRRAVPDARQQQHHAVTGLGRGAERVAALLVAVLRDGGGDGLQGKGPKDEARDRGGRQGRVEAGRDLAEQRGRDAVGGRVEDPFPERRGGLVCNCAEFSELERARRVGHGHELHECGRVGSWFRVGSRGRHFPPAGGRQPGQPGHQRRIWVITRGSSKVDKGLEHGLALRERTTDGPLQDLALRECGEIETRHDPKVIGAALEGTEKIGRRGRVGVGQVSRRKHDLKVDHAVTRPPNTRSKVRYPTTQHQSSHADSSVPAASN